MWRVTATRWRYLPTGWQRDNEMKSRAKKWRTGQQPQGGTWVHTLVTGTLPGKGPSTTQQGEQFSSTAVVLHCCSVCFFCPTATRSLFLAFNLITVDAAGVMRTRGQRYDGGVICKQTAFEFLGMVWDGRGGWGLKIPQTGYEARCWGWRTPTSDKRMSSINATVARQRGRKRGNAGEWVCLKKKTTKNRGWGGGRSVYGYVSLDKRLNLSGAGYPPGTPSQSISSGSQLSILALRISNKNSRWMFFFRNEVKMPEATD